MKRDTDVHYVFGGTLLKRFSRSEVNKYLYHGAVDCRSECLEAAYRVHEITSVNRITA